MLDKEKQTLLDLREVISSDLQKMSDQSQSFFERFDKLTEEAEKRYHETIDAINNSMSEFSEKTDLEKDELKSFIKKEQALVESIYEEFNLSLNEGKKLLTFFKKELKPDQFINHVKESQYQDALTLLNQGKKPKYVADQCKLPLGEILLLSSSVYQKTTSL